MSESSLRNVLKEMEGLQVEEAKLQNRRLEQQLWRSKEAAAALQDCQQGLKREHVDMRRKVEEARQAIISSMKKVKELEAKASLVPALQRHVLQLESQIGCCR